MRNLICMFVTEQPTRSSPSAHYGNGLLFILSLDDCVFIYKGSMVVIVMESMEREVESFHISMPHSFAAAFFSGYE